jgi:hypothetical protein
MYLTCHDVSVPPTLFEINSQNQSLGSSWHGRLSVFALNIRRALPTCVQRVSLLEVHNCFVSRQALTFSSQKREKKMTMKEGKKGRKKRIGELLGLIDLGVQARKESPAPCCKFVG